MTASMKLLSLSVWLGLLLAGVSYAAPANPALGNGNGTVFGPVNDALVARAVLEKREVFFGCSDQRFSVHLTQAIHDAREIVSGGPVFHFHLTGQLSIYANSGSLTSATRSVTQWTTSSLHSASTTRTALANSRRARTTDPSAHSTSTMHGGRTRSLYRS